MLLERIIPTNSRFYNKWHGQFSAFGEKTITSYLKLKEIELKDFHLKESFSKKDPITHWEKTNTIDC